MVAAGGLQSLIGSRDYRLDIAQMRVQMGKIRWGGAFCCPAIDVAGDRREAGAAPGGLRRRGDAFDEADDAYDPTEFNDEDDEFWPPSRPPPPRVMGILIRNEAESPVLVRVAVNV
jgi:hypothetical protein